MRKGCRTCRLFSLFVISPIMLSPNSQSPPRQLVSITHESPVYVKKVHSSHFYQSGHLDDARLAVLEDLGLRILQIAPETFIDFLAHPQPDFNIDATMWTLKSNLAVITNPSLISKRWKLTNAKTLFPSIKVAASREHAFKQTFTNTCFKPPSNKRTIWIFFAKILSSIIRRSSRTYNILSIRLLPG